jgi:hypothetical protein
MKEHSKFLVCFLYFRWFKGCTDEVCRVKNLEMFTLCADICTQFIL